MEGKAALIGLAVFGTVVLSALALGGHIEQNETEYQICFPKGKLHGLINECVHRNVLPE